MHNSATSPDQLSPVIRARITEFEGLRGFIACFVVFKHLLVYSGVGEAHLWRPLNSFLNHARGVDLFIILSGFVIFLMLDRRPVSYATFIGRRFWRIFPPYFVCLLLSVGVSFFALDVLARLPWQSDPVIQWFAQNWRYTHDHFWSHLAWHTSMLHGLWPNEVLPGSTAAFLDVAWTVSLEWQFYLAAPLIYFLLKRGSTAWLVLGAVAFSFVIRRLFGDWNTDGVLVTYNLTAFLPQMAHFFFIGAVSYFAYKAVLRSSWRIPALALPAVMLGLIMFCRVYSIWAWALVLGSYLLLQKGERSRLASCVSGPLNHRWAQAIGKISYPIYLLHIPVIYGGLWLLLRLRADWTPVSFAWALAGVTVPVILSGSYLLHRFVEEPAVEFGKRLIRGAPTGQAAATGTPVVESAEAR